MSFLLNEESTWMQNDFGLDRRLIKALSKIGFTYPTMIQAQCIPIALQGKDVLVRARTGSGKTVAFALPLLHKLLSEKEVEPGASPRVRCLVLVPTKELCKQIEQQMTALIYYCRDTVSLCSLGDEAGSVQHFRLQKRPDIIISTPARIAQQLRAGNVDLGSVQTLVIDEADLVLSFGYAEDVNFVITKLPKIIQGILLSATLSPELEKFKRVVLHNPAVLKLEESASLGHLLQFYLPATDSDKYLILYVFIKLGLLQGKGLIFVNDVNKCYKLKLFLQQFFISAAVLNSELPLNSRIHILEEFNRGVFDYLIATDACVDDGEEDDGAGSDDGEEEDKLSVEEEGDEEEEEEEAAESEVAVESSKKKSKQQQQQQAGQKRKKVGAEPAEDEDGDYGVSRGVDFNGVNFVINFDFPQTAAAYTHRIGRTARGGATGTALSFITLPGGVSHTVEMNDVALRDAEVLQQVQRQQPRLGGIEGDHVLAAIQSTDVDAALDLSNVQPAPLQFNMKELDNFRYRVEDTLRSVTRASVQELRAAELKREILNSTKLKNYFAENPNDLKVLRHDKAILHPIRQKNHLKHVPSYLIPASMRSVANIASKGRKKRKLGVTGGGKGRMTSEQRISKSKSKDPLFDSTQYQHSNNGVGQEVAADGASSAPVAPAAPRVFSAGEASRLGSSSSGRRQWQERHKKGQFSAKSQRKDPLRTPGSFIKSKAYK